MKKKTIIGIIVLGLMIGSLLFYEQVSEESIRKIAEETPGYNCPLDEPCTTCMFKGMVCDCGSHECECGNYTVNKTVCE